MRAAILPPVPSPARGGGPGWGLDAASLDRDGYAVLPALLSPGECRALAALYDDDRRFRSRVVMARHGFGQGEYKYFAHPLPEPVVRLRTALYAPLAAIANRWNAALGIAARYPDEHAEYLELCRRAGQTKPTPLMLRYGANDYNCLHQDIYGEHVFPLQATILLSDPAEFAGGEFVLVEQRPRRQSRAEVLAGRARRSFLAPERFGYTALWRHRRILDVVRQPSRPVRRA